LSPQQHSYPAHRRLLERVDISQPPKDFYKVLADAFAPVLPGVDVFVRLANVVQVNWPFGTGGRFRVVRSAFAPTQAATRTVREYVGSKTTT
jgi:hypothetical protein